MASSSTSFLIPYGDSYKFESLQKLRAFLHGSRPYEKCVGFAPRGKNAPYCSRDTGRVKSGQVALLLEELLQAPAISDQAGRLLDKLSTHLVCGNASNNRSYHLYQAPQVYEEWCNKLWCDYLHVNGLDPDICSEPPHQFTAATWQAKLEEIQRAHSNESGDDDDGEADHEVEEEVEELEEWEEEEEEDEEDEEEEGYDLDSESDSGDFPTPDTTITDFDEIPSTKGTSITPQGLQSSDRSPRRQGSPNRACQPSRSGLSVYHDPEAPGEAVQTPKPAQGDNSSALAPLDRNIAVSRQGPRTLPSWSHKETESTHFPSSVSHRTEPHRGGSGNTKKRLGIETSKAPDDEGPTTSDDDEAPAIQEEGGESKADKGRTSEGPEPGGRRERDAEGQAQTDAKSAPGPASSESVENKGTDSSRGETEEEPLETEAEGVRDGEIRLSSGPSSEAEDPTRDGNGGGEGFAGDFLAVRSGVFEGGADATEAASVQTGLPLPVTLPPGFLLYCEAPRPRKELKELLKTMTKTIPLKFCKSGFIYAFSRPSLPGLLKIGYVEDAKPLRPDPVDHRLGKWQADCGQPITEVFRERIDCKAVERIENLVHRTLAAYRRKEICSQCRRGRRKQRNDGERQGGKVHDEWFQVEEETARRVVGSWALFARQQPYDQFGRMVDFWSAKVNGKLRLIREGDTVMTWLEKMLQFVEEARG